MFFADVPEVHQAGCDALNTQTFFLPLASTLPRWEGSVPHTLMWGKPRTPQRYFETADFSFKMAGFSFQLVKFSFQTTGLSFKMVDFIFRLADFRFKMAICSFWPARGGLARARLPGARLPGARLSDPGFRVLTFLIERCCGHQGLYERGCTPPIGAKPCSCTCCARP